MTTPTTETTTLTEAELKRKVFTKKALVEAAKWAHKTNQNRQLVVEEVEKCLRDDEIFSIGMNMLTGRDGHEVVRCSIGNVGWLDVDLDTFNKLPTLRELN